MMNKLNEPVVRLNPLTHCYKSRGKDKGKTFKALDDISLEIGSGDIVGYVGLNGAGKTTTIKILSGSRRDRPDCQKAASVRCPFRQAYFSADKRS